MKVERTPLALVFNSLDSSSSPICPPKPSSFLGSVFQLHKLDAHGGCVLESRVLLKFHPDLLTLSTISPRLSLILGKPSFRTAL